MTLSPASPVRGQTATISALVRNTGGRTASNVQVSFYVTNPGGISRVLLSDVTFP